MSLTKRLNLGAGRLEKLDPQRLKIFSTSEWVHLGDAKLRNPNNKHLQTVDYQRTDFIAFNYSIGDRLPFQDKSFSFIFSEHFFEHLFLDESISLFIECRRVLVENGVMRVVVPDADLRPIPERLGFPNEAIGYWCPEKHKTRWSIYSLMPALTLSGFKAIPIKHYDKDGLLHDHTNSLDLGVYGGCLDFEVIRDFRIVKRRNSLIVDGIKWT